MKSGLLEHYRVFVHIARTGSLTGAADALGTGQPTISRQLAALEKHLGCRLLHRTTRHLSLTDKGRALLPHAEQLVNAADAAAHSVHDQAQGLKGRLRVTCSNAFGRHVLLPALPAWQRQHPDVHLELKLSDALEPVVKSGIDVAFRLGTLPSSGLVATRIGSSYSAAFASHDYLRRHGVPGHPRELHKHQCIVFSGAASPAQWTFVDRTGREISAPISSTLALSSVDLLQDAVIHGLGIALMPLWCWHEERLLRQVQRLFPTLRTPVRPVTAVAGSRHRPQSKPAVFTGFVREAWRPFEREPA